MHTTDNDPTFTTGTVEWFDAERGVGAIRPDDGTPPCAVRSDTLRACSVRPLVAGDRVRFEVREEGGERTATDLTLLRDVQRWENEGGAVPPGDTSAEGGRV
jgi:CspA family cold shock protein